MMTQFGRLGVLAISVLIGGWPMVVAQAYALTDGNMEVAVDAKGCLTSLRNVSTGQEYASGKPMWRLYFDRKDGEKEIQVLGAENVPEIKQEGGADRTAVRYAESAWG